MKVSVIIPYKKDRGWLKFAIESIPNDVELILSEGDGNWPQNFNKGLEKATGELIRYLHEDDMLTSNSIIDTISTFQQQKCDFIHGNAVEIYSDSNRKNIWIPKIQYPTLGDMLDFKRRITTMHSVSLVFHRRIFDKIGGFNESSEVYSFEEFEFILRCLKYGFKVGYCNSFLGYYRRHSTQTIRTVDLQKRKENRNKLIQKYV